MCRSRQHRRARASSVSQNQIGKQTFFCFPITSAHARVPFCFLLSSLDISLFPIAFSIVLLMLEERPETFHIYIYDICNFVKLPQSFFFCCAHSGFRRVTEKCHFNRSGQAAALVMVTVGNLSLDCGTTRARSTLPPPLLWPLSAATLPCRPPHPTALCSRQKSLLVVQARLTLAPLLLLTHRPLSPAPPRSRDAPRTAPLRLWPRS